MKKNIFITGSSKGIGLEIANKFYDENFNVFINSRHNPNKINKKFKHFKSDMTKLNDVKRISSKIKKNITKLDVLVCNIGFSKYEYNDFPSLNQINDSLEKNFFSCILILNELKDYLIKSKSKIICISSICGSESVEGAPINYSISKNLLNTYLKFISKSFAKNGVNLNIVSPGNVLFKGSTWEKKLKKNNAKVKNYLKKNVPLNKFASTKDIANAVFFLASDKNNFISGANLIIDGGQTNNL